MYWWAKTQQNTSLKQSHIVGQHQAPFEAEFRRQKAWQHDSTISKSLQSAWQHDLDRTTTRPWQHGSVTSAWLDSTPAAFLATSPWNDHTTNLAYTSCRATETLKLWKARQLTKGGLNNTRHLGFFGLIDKRIINNWLINNYEGNISK